jgi:hypothetical protein
MGLPYLWVLGCQSLSCAKLDQIYYISLDREFFDFLNFVNFRHVIDISGALADPY